MSATTRWRWLALVAAGAAAIAIAVAVWRSPIVAAPGLPARSHQLAERAPAYALERPASVVWLATGGGVEPSSNQVSLEQDMALAGRVLGGGGVTLFAGGPGHSPVQIEAEATATLHRRLGELFSPVGPRPGARYRPTSLGLHGDARADTVLDALAAALAQPGGAPLLWLVAAHGEPGEAPRDNLVRFWGGAPVGVADVAGVLADTPSPRPLVLVMATCFAGGFAEIAFDEADETKGVSDGDRCGLFATTWDTEAAGCDPNPDRRQQESYLLHLLHALEGTDRDGKAIGDIDSDGDGRVSLLEAHAQVRIASRSISIPTTTSERWLRQAAGDEGAGDDRAKAQGEDARVIRALGAALGVADAAATTARRKELEARADELAAERKERELDLDDALADLRIALLERWPVLDDAYHPDYQPTLAADGREIERVLDDSALAGAYARAADAAGRVTRAFDDIDVDIAMLVRLERAHENVRLAARLEARGGRAWKRYQRFLACERLVPQLAAH